MRLSSNANRCLEEVVPFSSAQPIRRSSKPKKCGYRRRAMLEYLETRVTPATITVTSLADNLSADGQVTLREAIRTANTDTNCGWFSSGKRRRCD